ncbi:MAG: DnaB-like helicase C-terminal domain-containing protein [Gemmatimonadota bacterium]
MATGSADLETAAVDYIGMHPRSTIGDVMRGSPAFEDVTHDDTAAVVLAAVERGEVEQVDRDGAAVALYSRVARPPDRPSALPKAAPKPTKPARASAGPTTTRQLLKPIPDRAPAAIARQEPPGAAVSVPLRREALDEAEVSVLGAVMVDDAGPVADRVLRELPEEDFRHTSHRLILRAIGSLRDRREGTDAVSIAAELETAGDLDRAGGLEYLASILDTVPTAVNVGSHIRIVREAAARRREERYRRQLIGDLEDRRRPVAQILAEASEEWRGAGWDRDRVSVEGLFRPYTLTAARSDRAAAGAGSSTGFPGFDEMGFLLQPGNVYGVAGRQGSGKTALLLEMAMRHVETTPDACAVVVSFEGQRYELYLRLLLRQVARKRVEEGQEPGAPPRRDADRWLVAGEIRYDDDTRPATMFRRWEDELAEAAEVLDAHIEAGRLVIIDGDDVPSEDGAGAVTASRLMVALSRAPRRPTLVLVDYFQKVRPDDRSESRYLQLATISDRLRRYAKGDGDPDRAVPVLTAAQVNRDAADRQPGLDNVREADDLGNDAAGLITIRMPDTDDTVKRMTLRIVKHRHGSTGGGFDLNFHGPTGYFAEPDAEAEKAARTAATRTRIRTDVARNLAENPDASTREIRENVKGNATVIGEVVKEIRNRDGTGDGTTL